MEMIRNEDDKGAMVFWCDFSFRQLFFSPLSVCSFVLLCVSRKKLSTNKKSGILQSVLSKAGCVAKAMAIIYDLFLFDGENLWTHFVFVLVRGKSHGRNGKAYETRRMRLSSYGSLFGARNVAQNAPDCKGGWIKSYFINHRNENSLGANDIFCADEKKSPSFKDVFKDNRDTEVDVFYVDLFLICASFLRRGKSLEEEAGNLIFLKVCCLI